jgi:hypothetical protein
MDYKNLPPSRSLRKKVPEQFGRHIFYGEGIKTEPKYVENMKKVLTSRYQMNPASDIIIVDDKSGGRSTLGLVKYIEKDVKNRIRNGQKIDHVWIFYDRDSFEKDDYDNAYNKIFSKNKKIHLNNEGDASDKNLTRWHPLWSNECFELWILLHFQYCDSSLSRESYIPSIDHELAKFDIKLTYEKNLSNLYEILEKHGNIKNAVKWAKKLNINLLNPNLKENPLTGIYELIQHFQIYLKIEL